MAINPITIEMALSEFIILEKFLFAHQNEIINLYEEMMKLKHQIMLYKNNQNMLYKNNQNMESEIIAKITHLLAEVSKHHNNYVTYRTTQHHIGGNIYQQKYLKYKSKYLELKNRSM